MNQENERGIFLVLLVCYLVFLPLSIVFCSVDIENEIACDSNYFKSLLFICCVFLFSLRDCSFPANWYFVLHLHGSAGDKFSARLFPVTIL